MDLEYYMKLALEEALKAEYKTSPNPMVGSILVGKEGQILNRGYHHKVGTPHAEVHALMPFKEVPEGSLLFVTLEPCCHQGRTPPCTDLLIQKKVKKVVIGTLDPNPLVAGKGVQKLRDHAIEVIENISYQDTVDLNRMYNKNCLLNLPYVVLKSGISLDGKIAMPSGESQWITGEESRAFGHRLRSRYQAIVIGKNTLCQDNPRLTDRLSSEPRDPIPVIFSTHGDIPETSYFFQNKDQRRIVVLGSDISIARRKRLTQKGIETLVSQTTIPTPKWALKQLYAQGICSLLLEGGGQMVASFLKQKLVDEAYLFVSEKIIGSSLAPSWCGELGVSKLSDVPKLTFSAPQKLGTDILLHGYFSSHVLGESDESSQLKD